jgi:23S rRNA pseudouridine1911/1915/1917 synthase
MPSRNVPVRYRVKPGEAGLRLDAFLAARCPAVTRGFIEKLLRKGECTVEGVQAAASDRVAAGVEVVLRGAPANVGVPAPDARVTFNVLHEDADVVAVDKPAGLVVHPGPGHRRGTLLNGLMARYGAALARLGARRDYGLVHRLDAGTSGALLVARTAAAHDGLVAQFRDGTVRKVYGALVAGRPGRSEGRIDAPLGQRGRGRTRVTVDGGHNRKGARTRYRLARAYGGFALLDVVPETGRMHQIRVHLASVGLPVAGDPEYGDSGANALLRRAADLRRPFLHCRELACLHPVTGAPLAVTSPLPEDLEGVLARLARGKSRGQGLE